MLKVTTLPSGLRVATYNIDRKMAALVVTIGAGRRYESPEEIGISHFLEHLLCTGTKSYPNPKSLKDSIESLGGFRNAYTLTDHTYFVVEILNEYLDQALKTVSEQLQDSLLKHEEIEKQKEIIKHELQGYIDDPENFANRSVNQVLWAKQPIGGAIQEEIANLSNINSDLIKNYLDKHYLASNMVITIAGKVDHDEWVKKVSSSLDRLPQATPQIPEPASNVAGTELKLEPREIKKLNLRLSFFGPSRHDSDRYATRLMRDILGHNLLDELRHQKGLTYGVNVDYVGLEDTGKLVVSGSFQAGKVEEVTKIISDNIMKMKSELTSTEDLSRSKARVKSNIVRLNERVFGLAEDYAFRIFFNLKPLLIEDEVKLFEKVSEKDILESANKYLDQSYFKVVAVGPAEDIKELEKLYGKSS